MKAVNWQVSMCRPAKPQVVAGDEDPALRAGEGTGVSIYFYRYLPARDLRVRARHLPGRGEPQNRSVQLDVAHARGLLLSYETMSMARRGSVPSPDFPRNQELPCLEIEEMTRFR
jgi:hypothetical protein